MKPITKFLVVIAAIFFCHNTYAQKEDSETAIINSGPHISFITKRNYDFGIMTLNSNASCQFQFKNTGNRPLVISDVHASGKEINEPSCKIQIKYSRHPIKPGKKGTISIKFIAQDDIGSFKKTIYVTSNATQNNSPLLLIQGTVTPAHIADPISQPDLKEENQNSIPVYPAKK